MARTKNAKAPVVGSEVPEFNLPSAQGGSLRLGMRTAMGPVIVAFFRGAWSGEDVSFFKALAAKEDEINLAIGNVVGIAVSEAAAAREFVKATGMKSYVLYDYAKVATPAWGLLEKDREHGEYARPATFLIDSENKVVGAWMDDRPNLDELLAKVSELTGLPKGPEEDDEEKPEKGKAAKKADGESGDAASGDAASGDAEGASEKPEREKPSPEEREKRRAERKAARESGESPKPGGDASGGEAEESAEGSEKPEKPSPDEREKRRAERKAARAEAKGEAGDSGEAEKSGEGSESKARKPEAEAESGVEGDASDEKKEKKEGGVDRG